MKSNAIEIVDELVTRYPALLPLRQGVVHAAQAVIDCHRRNGLVLVCGNGGSASDSGHIVGELVKGFMLPRRPEPAWLEGLAETLTAEETALFGKLQKGIRAVNLAEASALNTAVINDLSPELIFAQGVYAMGRPGDVVIGLSTSGNSVNVVRALQVGKARGLTCIGFTGASPARMDRWSDIVLKAPALRTHEIQEFHLPLYHAVCAMAERELFGD